MTLVDNFAQPNTSVAEPFPLCLERPLGAVVTETGTQFALWAPSAQKVTLRLFSRGSMGESGDALIGQYTMRPESDGSWTYDFADNMHGVYYDFLIERDCGSVDRIADPWARGAGVNGRRSMVVDFSRTNPDGWYRDHMPDVPLAQTVVWETHVGDFSNDPAGGFPESHRGKYLAFTDDGTSLDGHPDFPTGIAYLKKLGVTAVQLMPIYDFGSVDEETCDRYNWGYDPVNYNVPEGSYSTNPFDGSVRIREVKQMVQALHNAGIKVIMDVVYNHTCEGGVEGPTVCWRGLDDLAYYRHQKSNTGRLEDTTGCGNTLDFTNTHVVTFAIDSLRYWAKRIGIDGFRFDLGVTLARLEGEFTHHHPFLYALRSDLLLGNLKLIMEPWDLGNLGWRTGQFSVPFAEWNDRFRDTARTFWLEDVDGGSDFGRISLQEMSTRLCGSADLFATEPGRGAPASINFVSCHDGFTLTDLTRYRSKHNEANGENNNDGSSVNHSANFGVEGVTDDPDVIAAREQAAMNMIGMLLLSLGTPMMLAGDEFRNTQDGNNNAYCQDNDITWLKWDWMYSTNKTREMRRLETVSRLVALRKSLDLYHHEDFFTRLTQLGLLKPSSRVQWFLPDGTTPMERDWFDLGVRSFTMRLLSNSEVDVCIVVNGTADDRTFRLPPDTHWTPKWCSAEINGRRAGHGTQVEECDLNGDTTVWTQHVPDASETVLKMVKEVAMQRTESSTENEADTIKFAMPVTDHAANGTSSAPRDEVSADMPDAPVDDTPDTPVDDNVWTMPALSITLMKQV